MALRELPTSLLRPPVTGSGLGLGKGRQRLSKISVLALELWRDPVSFAGMVILLIMVLAAIFAPFVAPHDPTAQSLRARLMPPFWMARGSIEYLLGTDYLGRDILSRIIYGARASLTIGASVVAIAGSFGIALGMVSGYFGGRTDNVIMRIVETQLAFPGLLLNILILSSIGTSPLTLIIVLAINGWMVYARVTRGIVLSLRQRPFVEAGEIIGASPWRILWRHILPNLSSPLLTLAMLEFARIVLVEAALSFLGLGIQPPNSSWGLDVSTGRQYMFVAWWLVTFPGLAIALSVLALNLLATWVRTTSDPQQREKRFSTALRSRLAKAARRRPIATMRTAAQLAGAAAALDEAGLDDAARPLLSISDLAVQFHTRAGTVDAVRGVNLEIRRGETIGIVGESGSGKSVTAQAILGLVNIPGEIVRGDIRWKDRPLLGAANSGYLRSIRGKEISMISQDPMAAINPLLTVGTQIGEVLHHHLGMSAAQARARTIELLTLVGISAPDRRIDNYPFELSGGMCQRVMIAMALACEPELLIADEPTTALDVTIQAQILDLLASLQERLGLAVLLITHDLGVVARLCHRVAVMYGGRFVEEGETDRLFARPLHPYTMGLLRSTPRLSDQAHRLETIEGTPPSMLGMPPGCSFYERCPSRMARCQASDPPLMRAGDARTAACFLVEPGVAL